MYTSLCGRLSLTFFSVISWYWNSLSSQSCLVTATLKEKEKIIITVTHHHSFFNRTFISCWTKWAHTGIVSAKTTKAVELTYRFKLYGLIVGQTWTNSLLPYLQFHFQNSMLIQTLQFHFQTNNYVDKTLELKL